MAIRKRNVIVSLDIGTSTIKAALGEINNGQEINILGISQVPSYGLRKGNIVDIESTAKAVNECLNDLERLTGADIFSALVGFSGVSVSAMDNHAVVAVGTPGYEITQEDKDRVLQSARNIALPLDKVIVQTIERQYIVDGYEGVKDPVGMIGSRLEAEVAVIVAATAAIQNIYRSTERINLKIEKCVYNPLLAAESVLLPTEKEMGVVLVDFGGGTVEISFFEKGSILCTSVLPIGGEYITKDLAIVLKTSLEEASRIKEHYGVASPSLAQDNSVVSFKNIQGKEVKEVSRQVIADIISARVIEIMEMIYAELKHFNCLNRIPGGIVVTGGGARLSGITDIMEDYFNLPVRIGIPENIRGISSDLNLPQNAAVLGAIIYAAKHPGLGHPYIDKPGYSGLFDKIGYFLKDLFS